MEREAAKERRATPNTERVNFTPSEKGKSLDFTAAAVGMSRPTLAKAREVVEAARERQAAPDYGRGTTVEKFSEVGA